MGAESPAKPHGWGMVGLGFAARQQALWSLSGPCPWLPEAGAGLTIHSLPELGSGSSCLTGAPCLLCSVLGFPVDAAAGGLQPEGPQRLPPHQAPGAQLRQRLCRPAGLPRVLRVGQQHPPEQPVRPTPRYTPACARCQQVWVPSDLSQGTPGSEGEALAHRQSWPAEQDRLLDRGAPVQPQRRVGVQEA